ncbi:MAG TPA: hypothetical protein VM599_03500, partial [Thermoanaerobaculia bacterium]|nr:hypothetical protein [Thermoanaerobaculia bacterium]
MARNTTPAPSRSLRRARRRAVALWRLPRARRWILWGGGGIAALLLALVVWGLWPYWRLAGQFDDVPARQPSRLYGRSPVLTVGHLVDVDGVVGRLGDEGYRALAAGETAAPGRYQRSDGALTVYQRIFPTLQGPAGGAPLVVRLQGRRIAGLELGGQPVEAAYLDPPLVATYYGPDVKERRPVRVDDLPEELV